MLTSLRYAGSGGLAALACVLALSGCSSSPVVEQGQTTRLNVVATTTIVGDVVQQVGGNAIALTVLLPPDSDPHNYQPTPQDVATIANADVVFINGLGLEGFIENLIINAGSDEAVISVSDGIVPKRFDSGALSSGGVVENTGDQDHEDGDPHVWTDPTNVQRWVENIALALGQRDPENAPTYTANAASYQTQLSELDQWIRLQIESIPTANRLIVTDHQAFGYYAERYGLRQVATIIPGYSTASEPTARELAALTTTIGQLGVSVLFVGRGVNSSMAQRIAEDTGSRLAFVYSGSLGQPGEEAGTYIDYMRFNTSVFASSLR